MRYVHWYDGKITEKEILESEAIELFNEKRLKITRQVKSDLSVMNLARREYELMLYKLQEIQSITKRTRINRSFGKYKYYIDRYDASSYLIWKEQFDDGNSAPHKSFIVVYDNEKTLKKMLKGLFNTYPEYLSNREFCDGLFTNAGETSCQD